MVKCGIDIIEINRIENAIKKHENFINKNFSEREILYIEKKKFRGETVAGMFAAKEAFSKYLGTGVSGFSLCDIEILHDENFKPYVVFKGRRVPADLSISHSKENAVATVSGEEFKDTGISEDTLLRMRNYLPERKKDAHKGDFGRVFILGGSLGMTGAVCLSATSALRCGAGLVTVGCPETQREIAAVKLTEAMTMPFSDKDGLFEGLDTEKIIEKVTSSSVCALGMGMGRGKGAEKVTFDVIENASVPLVIDADGINAVSLNIDVLKSLKAGAVITPHPGEMMRLTGEFGKTDADRLRIATEFAKKYKVVTVLKGKNTVIAAPDGRYTVNETGNSGMATGGSGDVLSGMIAAFIGQGAPLYEAAVLSCYLHGRAGDLAAEDMSQISLIASDIIRFIPSAIKELLI